MIELGVRTKVTMISKTVTKENREGGVQVYIQVQGMEVTDAELADLIRLQEELAIKVDEVLGKDVKKTDLKSQSKKIKYKNGRPYFENK